MSQIYYFRPISILSIVSKVTRENIDIQLINFLEENNQLSKHQCERSLSTEQAVILSLGGIRSNVGRWKLVGGCFIDLTKAFETIRHSKRMSILPHDQELGWLAAYLFSCKAIV